MTQLVGRQEGHLACKNRAVGCWRGYLSGADLHMAQRIPLPVTVSCLSKIPTGFAFLVPAHPGSPGQRAVKGVCVCVYYYCGTVVVACRRTAGSRQLFHTATQADARLYRGVRPIFPPLRRRKTVPQRVPVTDAHLHILNIHICVKVLRLFVIQ